MIECEFLSGRTGTDWRLRIDGPRVVVTRKPIPNKRGTASAASVVFDETAPVERDLAALVARAFEVMLAEGNLYEDNNRTIDVPIAYAKLARRAKASAPSAAKRRPPSPVDAARAKLAKSLRAAFHYVIALEAWLLEADDPPLALGESRVGGAPDLPRSFRWPERKGKPLAFFAQLDFAAIAPHDLERRLPERGWMVHFIADTGYGDAFYFPASAKLVRRKPPAHRLAIAAYQLKFAPAFVLDHDRAAPAKTTAAIAKALGNGARLIEHASDRLLGAPMDLQAMGDMLWADGDDDANDHTLAFQFEHGDGYVLVGVPRDELRAGDLRRARAIYTGT